MYSMYISQGPAGKFRPRQSFATADNYRPILGKNTIAQDGCQWDLNYEVWMTDFG